MNLLLFEQDECTNNHLRLNGTDRRARHILDILGLQAGDTVRVGMVNGPLGTGKLLAVSDNGVEMEISAGDMPAPARDMTLILALPRPIMLQRILKQATVMGVRHFHLIRSSRVQKSFFQSTALQEGNIRSVLLQGLEQAMDTRLPEVVIHNRFRPFVEDVVPGLPRGCRLVAHPDSSLTMPDLYHRNGITGDLVLAIGPEGGWNDFEVQSFREQGFAGFSFGSRILHVDTAVLVLLSQLMILQDIGPA